MKKQMLRFVRTKKVAYYEWRLRAIKIEHRGIVQKLSMLLLGERVAKSAPFSNDIVYPNERPTSPSWRRPS